MGFKGGRGRASGAGRQLPVAITPAEMLWALGSLCALHQKSYSAELLAHEFPATAEDPYTESTLIQAAGRLGFKIKAINTSAQRLARLPLPLLISLKAEAPGGPLADAFHPSEFVVPQGTPQTVSLALVTAATADRLVLFMAGQNQPRKMSIAEVDALQTGDAWLFAPEVAPATDEDASKSASGVSQTFGFRWFVPELVRHRKVWRDVLLASLALQIVALANPCSRRQSSTRWWSIARKARSWPSGWPWPCSPSSTG